MRHSPQTVPLYLLFELFCLSVRRLSLWLLGSKTIVHSTEAINFPKYTLDRIETAFPFILISSGSYTILVFNSLIITKSKCWLKLLCFLIFILTKSIILCIIPLNPLYTNLFLLILKVLLKLLHQNLVNNPIPSKIKIRSKIFLVSPPIITVSYSILVFKWKNYFLKSMNPLFIFNQIA